MDLSTGGLIAGLLLSSVGLGLFLYGKKERRAPQLGGGVLLMVLPFLPVGPWLQAAIGLALVGAVVWAVRAGK